MCESDDASVEKRPGAPVTGVWPSGARFGMFVTVVGAVLEPRSRAEARSYSRTSAPGAWEGSNQGH
jgi:hypothetical protein